MTREKIPTVFELSVPGRHGVDLPAPDVPLADLPTGELRAECGLPELSQLEVMRHYTALSQRNFGVDTGFYPLGSCTMKFIPRSTRSSRGSRASPSRIRCRIPSPFRATSR